MVEEQKARVESLKLLKSLDAQIEEKQKMEQADFKQFLAEKRLIDEIIAKVRMSYQLSMHHFVQNDVVAIKSDAYEISLNYTKTAQT